MLHLEGRPSQQSELCARYVVIGGQEEVVVAGVKVDAGEEEAEVGNVVEAGSVVAYDEVVGVSVVVALEVEVVGTTSEVEVEVVEAISEVEVEVVVEAASEIDVVEAASEVDVVEAASEVDVVEAALEADVVQEEEEELAADVVLNAVVPVMA